MDECTAGCIRPQYLFDDAPCAPGEALPDYGALDFVSHGSRLYGEVMWPGGGYEGPRPCVIFLHGFPGTARNDDLAHALCRIGCVTLTPYHRGAWGSEGEYLITRCIEDAIALAEHVRAEPFAARCGVDPERIYLLGHSVGGNSAIHAAEALPWLRGVILLAPFDAASLLRPDREELLWELLDEGKCLRSAGAQAIYDDIADNREKLLFASAAEALRERNLLCVTGTEDPVAPAQDMFQPLWERLRGKESAAVQRFVELPDGHGLLRCRIRLTRLIAQFIADTV